MTGHRGFDELIDALRGAFAGADGAPIDVETHQLDAAQLRRVMDGGLAVVVPGHEVRAELLLGVTVSAAVGVVSRGQGVPMFATDQLGPSTSSPDCAAA